MTEHPLVRLARQTITIYLKEKKIVSPPQELISEMKERAGVFVSLHRHHALRGCIGTFLPTTDNVAQEIIRNAIEAATRDPRFLPMRADEIEGLEISVDLLDAPEKVALIKDLDAKEYGVIVKSRSRRGLLLPSLPGVNTPEEQIKICRQKAGINDSAPVELFRFKVRRFH
ncbi:AmmeMemoRadiSam system protein A [Candidatus Saganbacteria bacterium CG08_land_8_20_14_0_20_45_16]|uniref:AmmeMemoRadiSam system protein A n=1 Tax=Candidatus Saganbacteria bacterium CG08_land_8_20_14_0_20_45_16 TaxID=2014293 RepID=A0A2H0Y0F8_UNCSA|nr:MAG: AmmeMemoRadiSam system protein A [Candidatus Saganbacteria bacterium CG08_land_8_20_14_0_20_45_16]